MRTAGEVRPARTVLTAASLSLGECVRDVAEWIRGTLASRREAKQPPPGKAALRAVLEGRAAAILFVGSTTEPRPGAALLASEAGLPSVPVAEGGIFIVDVESGTVLETLPFAEHKTGPRINGDAVHNTSGRARILDNAVRDITPYTRPLRQARLRAEELATANRRKDEFLAMLGHELRSPLAAIQNAVRLLSSQTGETPPGQRTQALIERQVRRMTQLVDDLLDVSRICHGRLHLQRERIDLRAVVSNAIETLESDINERHHRLTTTLPDVPAWLQADPWRLEQVFVNLLANASRYTDAHGELAVWVHTRDGQAVVGIRDSGIGIAPDALAHIFDLFRQADEAAPRSKLGLGIGLALARNLVELHGGSVTVASAGIGQGSEFTVRLPREVLQDNR
jgi:signal transduction histidine kinase